MGMQVRGSIRHIVMAALVLVAAAALGLSESITTTAVWRWNLVPAGSAAALICDTGVLLDYLVENAPDHRLFLSASSAVPPHGAVTKSW